MSQPSVGRQAEARAATFLQSEGYTIIEQNWKTRWCEIDIVARHRNSLLFVEVKYRQTDHQGAGLEYITPRKLKQMTLAANWYVSDHDWTADYGLAAVEVSGDDFVVTRFVVI